MLPYKYRVLPGCGYAYRTSKVLARVPCLFDHLLPEILPRESEKHFEGAIERFNRRLDPLTIIIKKKISAYRSRTRIILFLGFAVSAYPHSYPYRTRTRTRAS
ncbi:hypothetical protein CsSME_00036103 [Camellia sinensis var. sinensis]